MYEEDDGEGKKLYNNGKPYSTWENEWISDKSKLHERFPTEIHSTLEND